MLLFIVPGFVAFISYIMSPRIFVDGEKDPLACIKKSTKMMRGYKWDYFMFVFSFIGWFFLSLMTFGIALIYVIPYFLTADTLYYEELKKIS